MGQYLSVSPDIEKPQLALTAEAILLAEMMDNSRDRLNLAVTELHFCNQTDLLEGTVISAH